MGILFASILGLAMCAIFWFLAYPAIRNRRLMRGELQVARIRSVRRGFMTITTGARRSPQMHFELEVYCDGVLSHHVRVSREIPETVLALALPGVWVEIRGPYRERSAEDGQYPADGPKEWTAIAAFGVSQNLIFHVPLEQQDQMPHKQVYAELKPERFVYSAPVMATVGVMVGVGAVVFANYAMNLNRGGQVCEDALRCCEELQAYQPKIAFSIMRHCQSVKPDDFKEICASRLRNLELFAERYGVQCKSPEETYVPEPPFPWLKQN